MANFGDIYSYQIQVTAAGAAQVQGMTAALAAMASVTVNIGAGSVRTSVQLANMTAAIDNVGYQTTQTVAVLERIETLLGQKIPSASKKGMDGLKQLSSVIFAAVNLMEDAQFGARGLANNLLQIAIIATSKAHPALQAVAAVGTVLATSFGREQIDSFLAWAGILDENLIPKAKEAKDALDEMATAGGRVAKALSAESGKIQEAGAEYAKLIDDLSAESEGKLVQAALSTKGADRRIADLEYEIKKAQHELNNNVGPLEFFRASKLRESISGYLDEINKVRAESMKAAQAEIDQLIANASKGSEEAKKKLIGLAGSVGTPELLEYAAALWKTTDEAKRSAAEVEKVAKARERLIEQLKEQKKKQDDLMKAEAAAAEENAQRLLRAWELEKQIQAEKDRAAADRLGHRGDVQANAFRDMLAPQIQAMLADAAGRGMDANDAKIAVAGMATQAMMQSGVKPLDAGNAARKLVEEQAGFVDQLVANMDAVLGMLVGQERRGTWARRQAAIQANQLRAMQLRMPQDPWRNNRAGWP